MLPNIYFSWFASIQLGNTYNFEYVSFTFFKLKLLEMFLYKHIRVRNKCYVGNTQQAYIWRHILSSLVDILATAPLPLSSSLLLQLLVLSLAAVLLTWTQLFFHTIFKLHISLGVIDWEFLVELALWKRKKKHFWRLKFIFGQLWWTNRNKPNLKNC